MSQALDIFEGFCFSGKLFIDSSHRDPLKLLVRGLALRGNLKASAFKIQKICSSTGGYQSLNGGCSFKYHGSTLLPALAVYCFFIFMCFLTGIFVF